MTTPVAECAGTRGNKTDHGQVGNTKAFSMDDWAHEMTLAKNAGIDAFALNMANNDSTNDIALPLAFSAAVQTNFKLFFSFDYAGHGPWKMQEVISKIQTYGSKPTYFTRGSQPFVSTFEGPKQASDWIVIKKITKCFFIPDWSSVGAKPAVGLAGGIADGLFSWDAWPHGDLNMTTFPDASYYEFLDSKPYMLPVSPWFYTNLPGYSKNWLWRGDNLWFHRWQQVRVFVSPCHAPCDLSVHGQRMPNIGSAFQVLSLDKQPDYIQIISWNDYGESHYIGPLDNRQYEAFDIGKAPFNYVQDMPHDGWREFLPYLISMYKTGSGSFNQEGLTVWYRRNPNGACGDGGTTGNTASQLQFEYSPNLMMQDRVFFTALLGSNAQVKVTIGGTTQTGAWEQQPYGGLGLYHGSVGIKGATGLVSVNVVRGSNTVASVNGDSITTSCTNGLNNYNAWVGSNRAPVGATFSTSKSLALLNCTEGFGVYDFAGLCAFSCHK